MGNEKKGSDIDIALKGNISQVEVTQISAEFNENLPLPYRFDIVAYALISHIPLIEHIDKFGKSFYVQTI